MSHLVRESQLVTEYNAAVLANDYAKAKATLTAIIELGLPHDN